MATWAQPALGDLPVTVCSVSAPWPWLYRPHSEGPPHQICVLRNGAGDTRANLCLLSHVSL